MDEAGDLYGTTDYGGAYGWGTIFKLAPDGTETVLHSFANSDGIVPNGLMMDEAGNLYGMTQADGDGGDGTVYKLAPDGIYTVLHSFRTNKDGGRPVGNLIMGHGGKLYGHASTGGPHGGGTVFRLNPPDSAAAAEDER